MTLQGRGGQPFMALLMVGCGGLRP